MKEPPDMSIRYRFNSSLGDMEESRYITEITGEICVDDESGKAADVIGKIDIKMLLLDYAYNDGYNLMAIFDYEAFIMHIGEIIYDFENEDIDEAVRNFFDDSFVGTNICMIKRLEILPAYQRKGLGKKIIKDIYNRFNPGCALVVVQPFPLQFEWNDDYTQKTEWFRKMRYSALEEDFEKAVYQLKAFYQKTGFVEIPEVTDELMFMNPAFRSEKLDSIRME